MNDSNNQLVSDWMQDAIDNGEYIEDGIICYDDLAIDCANALGLHEGKDNDIFPWVFDLAKAIKINIIEIV